VVTATSTTSGDPLCPAALGDRHVIEDSVFTLIEHEQVGGERKAVVPEPRSRARDGDEPLGGWMGEWLQQHAVDDAEDRRHRANPERERQRGNDEESRLLAKHAERLADVLDGGVHRSVSNQNNRRAFARSG
jgi:hypothetical protein